jgi:hypothetical protein
MNKLAPFLLVLFLGFNANAQLNIYGRATIRSIDVDSSSEVTSTSLFYSSKFIKITDSSLAIGHMTYKILAIQVEEDIMGYQKIYKIFIQRALDSSGMDYEIDFFYYDDRERKLWRTYKFYNDAEFWLVYKLENLKL